MYMYMNMRYVYVYAYMYSIHDYVGIYAYVGVCACIYTVYICMFQDPRSTSCSRVLVISGSNLEAKLQRSEFPLLGRSAAPLCCVGKKPGCC